MVGDDNWTNVQACLYGDDGATAAEREQPPWQAWLDAALPALAR